MTYGKPNEEMAERLQNHLKLPPSDMAEQRNVDSPFTEIL